MPSPSISPKGSRSNSAPARGRAVLPAVVTDRVRPGNCFVPFHWNDEHGEYLTINALTNDAVDPESLQPEFKVCAVSLRPVKVVSAPSASDLIAAELGLGNTRPTLIEDEKLYLAGFLTGIGDTPAGVPVLPAGAPVRNEVRLWIDGLLAGRYIRSADGAAKPAAAVAADGPLVLWASQTGNAEEFAGEWPNGSRALNWSTWTTCHCRNSPLRTTSWWSPAPSATAVLPTTAPISGIA